MKCLHQEKTVEANLGAVTLKLIKSNKQTDEQDRIGVVRWSIAGER